MAKETFELFVNSERRNAWVSEPGIKIYVRRGIPQFNRGDFDLATFTATKQGKGACTRFLDKYEPQYQFFIENVQTRRFCEFFLRRGYRVVGRQPTVPLENMDLPISLLGPVPERKKA